MNGILTKSLREQVYEYFKGEINNNRIKKGEFININDVSKKLGISKTPLRDALLQLEMDGFVKILPRKGIVVNELTLNDIKDAYEIIGALECSALSSEENVFNSEDIQQMEDYNEDMKKALTSNNFDKYYSINIKLHNEFLKFSKNEHLKKIIDTLKQRLYDFPRNRKYVAEWEINSAKEHDKIIRFLKSDRFREAGNFIRDVHWSFNAQKKYIDLYYFRYKR